jgi:hypothetical protein
MTSARKAETLFSRVALYVIVFMMGLLIGTIVAHQFQSECKRFFAYHPDAPVCELETSPFPAWIMVEPGDAEGAIGATVTATATGHGRYWEAPAKWSSRYRARG